METGVAPGSMTRSVGDGKRKEGKELPVGDARHDLGLNILLDSGPRFAVLGRLGGQQLAQVARLDRRDDVAGVEGVEVGDDWSELRIFFFGI